ncbi:MAG: glycosyltransferase family 9 protein, partial [Bdellovibrionales bacterium]
MSSPSDTYKTIGVLVGRDLVGDALIKLPFLRALRNAWPAAEISWITSQGPTAFAGQLREPTQALINNIYEKPEWLRTHGAPDSGSGLHELMSLARQVLNPRARPEMLSDAPHFDLLIDTRNRWREAIHARKVPHRLFLSPAMHFIFSDRRPPFLGSRPQHLCDQLLELVQLAAGILPPSTGALP